LVELRRRGNSALPISGSDDSERLVARRKIAAVHQHKSNDRRRSLRPADRKRIEFKTVGIPANALQRIAGNVFAQRTMGCLSVERRGPVRGLRAIVPRRRWKTTDFERRWGVAQMEPRREGAVLHCTGRKVDGRHDYSEGIDSGGGNPWGSLPDQGHVV